MIVIPDSGLEKLTDVCLVYLGEMELFGGNEKMMLKDASYQIAKNNSESEIREKVRALIASILDGGDKNG